MTETILYVGDHRWSSWSLRPYLVLRQSDIPFATRLIPLRSRETAARIAAISPSGKVPCLHHQGEIIPDSLAISEFVAELAPDARLWPKDAIARAAARALACEMHAGFAALRQCLPMDIGVHRPIPDDGPWQADVARIIEALGGAMRRFGAGGPFVFGHFTIVDAMYAPVMTRFETYGVSLPPEIAALQQAIFALPAMIDWRAQALAEQAAQPI